jgi:hypothetical protein
MSNFITRLFNFDAEKALAKDMSEQILQTISPKLMTERRRVLSAKKVSLSIEGSYEKAKAYQSEHKPGAIRRAILANNFKWELKSLGYPDDFIDVATEGLIFALEKKATPKKS